MSAVAQVKFTYEDYCLMPEDRRYELIEGDLLTTPAPTIRHQTLSKRLQRELMNHLEDAGIGTVFNAPVDIYLSDENVFQPDLVAVAKNREGMIKVKYIRGAPDLLIEILSTEHPERDRVIKRKLYQKFGVKEFWMVDPDASSIEVWGWEQSGYALRAAYTTAAAASTVFPTLRIPLDRVF